MRIWSIHPKYLDSKGLIALWRETLLAKKVLQEATKGYGSHPQLLRFKRKKNPVNSINQYLAFVYEEAMKRNYNFNKDKIDWSFQPHSIWLNSEQLMYERIHLLNKLKIRDTTAFNRLNLINNPEVHPIFEVTEGPIEEWEILKY